jgi:nucleoside-diphosphate-sugar epimerase
VTNSNGNGVSFFRDRKFRALITGGAGFLGSHLAEALLSQGHEVLILDDLSTGSIQNVRDLKENRGLRYWIDSLANKPLLSELVDECDIIFHLAAAVGVRLIVESPVHTIETNVAGTELVLKAACKKKKPVFIASTSEVYGKSARVPFCEVDDLVLGTTTRGRWSYAATKLLDEFLALAYLKEKKLPVYVVRFFNIVGPRQSGRYGMVLPNFVSQAMSGEDVTVFGSGKQTRCFCYVGDAVKAIIGLIQRPEAVGEIFNIGSDHEISIEDLADRVIARLGSRSRIRRIPYEMAYEQGFEDMMRRIPSLEKITGLTGWRPVTSLDTCIDLVAKQLEQRARRPEAKAAPAESTVAAGI